jgi:hypothetical protein
MINKYLSYLQEDKEDLNEFVVLPVLLLSMQIYKKYTEHKKIVRYCMSETSTDGRKKCVIKYKINALNRTIIEINKLKSKCELSTNIKKCVNKIDKEIERLTREMSKLKTKLAKL